MSTQIHTDLFKRWILDPLVFIQTMIIDPYNKAMGGDVKITTQQKGAIEDIRKLVTAKLKKHNKVRLNKVDEALSLKFGVSIMAGKGLGKDALASWVILWFMMCFPNCKIPCTSVSADQLNKVLWSELSKWLQNSPVREFLTLENQKLYFNQIEDGGKRWFAYPKTANPKASLEEQVETLAGVHEDFVMIVVDEASGISNAVFDPLEGTLTGACNFVLMIFNPTRSKGYAIDTHGKDSNYWVPIRWNGEESEIIDKKVIERIKEKYGVDSNPYRIRVLGLPPLVDEQNYFPADWIMDAVDREITPRETDQIVKSLDCGAGGDKSVIITRKGGKVYDIKRLSTPDSTVLTNWALNDFLSEGADVLRIDSIGIGWAIYGNLSDKLGGRVESADSRRRADNPDRYFNKRAEMYSTLRDKFEKGLISIPNDIDLIDQLSAIKAVYEGGKTKIIEKGIIRKELGHSPDEADTLAISYYYDDIMSTGHKMKNIYCNADRVGLGNTSANGWLGA